MTATTELREAASNLRVTVENITKLSEWYGADFSDVVLDHVREERIGFANAPLALAVAAWLIEEADTLDLLNIEPTAALAVARHINEGVTS